jgi:hypothetical protein
VVEDGFGYLGLSVLGLSAGRRWAAPVASARHCIACARRHSTEPTAALPLTLPVRSTATRHYRAHHRRRRRRSCHPRRSHRAYARTHTRLTHLALTFVSSHRLPRLGCVSFWRSGTSLYCVVPCRKILFGPASPGADVGQPVLAKLTGSARTRLRVHDVMALGKWHVRETRVIISGTFEGG